MSTGTNNRRSAPAAQEIRFWMSAPAATVMPNTALSEALALMQQRRIRRLPVVDAAGRLLGIVTIGDIRGADAMGRALVVGASDELAVHFEVARVMTECPHTATPTTSLSEAALVMLDNKVGALPVVDGENKVVGIITESDLFEALVCYLDRAQPG